MWIGTSAFWIDHLHPDDRELEESCCRVVAENRGPQQFEHRMIAADERVMWLRTSLHLVSSPGEAQELAGVMMDITDCKLAEEAAEEASRTKSRLLAEISGLYDQLKVFSDWIAKINLRRTPDRRKDGRHEETRTPDLYRVKVAL
jgi:PAS fold